MRRPTGFLRLSDKRLKLLRNIFGAGPIRESPAISCSISAADAAGTLQRLLRRRPLARVE
jgi:hypothetical protein